MNYVLDIVGMAPGVVVVATEDDTEAQSVADRYALEVQRPIVIAVGPPPDGGRVPLNAFNGLGSMALELSRESSARSGELPALAATEAWSRLRRIGKVVMPPKDAEAAPPPVKGREDIGEEDSKGRDISVPEFDSPTSEYPGDFDIGGEAS